MGGGTISISFKGKGHEYLSLNDGGFRILGSGYSCQLERGKGYRGMGLRFCMQL